MATNKKAVFSQAIEQTARIISPEIMLNPVVLGKASIFDPLGIKVEQGIQKKKSQPIYMRKGKIAKPYSQGMDTVSAGAFAMSDLEVFLSASFVDINIQDFDDVIIGNENLLGTNKEPKRIPFAEQILWGISNSFSEDLLECIVFGKYDKDGNGSYPNYNGESTIIKEKISNGEINERAGNLIKAGEFPSPVSDSDTTAWDNFEAVLKKLNPALLKSPVLLAKTSTTTQGNILSAYYNKFKHTLTPQMVEAGNFFLTYPNVKLKGSAVYGKGDAIVFTIPNNCAVGVDQLSDDEFCDVTQLPTDKNIFRIQIQGRFGYTIKNISPKVFAVTDGEFIPYDAPLSGDIQDEMTIQAVSNDTSLGTVGISPQKDKYEFGEIVTLTATAVSTNKFITWDDGVQVNPRKVTATGYPLSFKAVFAAADSE